MSVQNKRIQFLTDAILKDNLQRGILPDSQEFIWQLNTALHNLNNDKSSFLFKPYRNTEILESKKINEDNTKIKNDLKVLYSNSSHINDLLNKEYQYFLTKKKRLEKELDKEANRLKEYVENNKRSGLLPYVYDTFDDTDKVDLNKTSKIFVDTNNNTAKIVEEKNTSRRIFPNTKMKFTLKPDSIETKQLDIEGKLENILNDKEDLVWQKQIFTKENIELSGNLELIFDESQLINNIHLSAITVKPFLLSIHFTPDGQNWYTLPYNENVIEVEKEIALDFPEMEIKGIRFIADKTEYDEQSPEEDNYNYQYLFGFENISFYNKSYPTKGVLYSNELDLQNKPENYVVDTVQLYTDDWTPTGTDIEYQVGLPAKEIDWQPIDPVNRRNPQYPQKVYFHNLRRNYKNELYFPDNLSIRQSEAEDLLVNGIPLYKLSYDFKDEQQFYIPPLQLLEGSLKLYVGKNTAEVISFPASSVNMDVEDFLEVKDNREHYYQELQSIDSGDIFINKTDNEERKYLIRIGLYLDRQRNITATPVSNDEIMIHLNGDRVFEGRTAPGDNVHYTFRSGWNEIVILINGQSAKEVNGISTSLGFNFFDLTKDIYSSSEPLKEVSVFDLQNNVKIHDRTVFAKRSVENGIEILTNFAQKGLTFDFYFDYKEDFKEEKGILLKATMNRQNGDDVPSPLIRKYRLELS